MYRGLRAEWERLRGHPREALGLYARAAEGAARHGYRQQAALLHERRAGLLARLRRSTEAASDLARAVALYEAWGATAKAERLRREGIGGAFLVG
jgi:hypothetical protein